ncbi:hypothetical protein [Ohtaekwangia sp.]|uniref:hypothetical protein n=1 Tax=Ohtaekwangia sp. TaxID=2066019 RepID=UPI002FDE9F99
MSKKEMPGKPVFKKLLVKKAEVNRAENSVSYESEWESMFKLAERWESDVKFFEDEINFLNELLARYTMWPIDDAGMENTRHSIDELLRLARQRDAIAKRIEIHFTHLTDLVQNPFSHDEQRCKDEHAKIGANVADLVQQFREVKRKVFALTEHVMNIEKTRHLLNS